MANDLDSTSITASMTNWSTTTVSEIYHNFGICCQVQSLNSALVNRDVTKKQHPTALRPLTPELSAFARFNHEQILYPLLR